MKNENFKKIERESIIEYFLQFDYGEIVTFEELAKLLIVSKVEINENIKNGEDLLEDINKVILKILKNYDYSDNFTTKNNILRSAVKIRCKFYKNLYYTLIPLGVGGVLINTMQDVQTIVLFSTLIIIGAILCGKMCKYMYIDFVLREVLEY